ncbi:MAG: sigma-70 family RNA polymerase sigma factor [Caulobacteraceae bacterium]
MIQRAGPGVLAAMTLADSTFDALGPGRWPRRRSTWSRVGERAARHQTVGAMTAEDKPPALDATACIVAIAERADREAFASLFRAFAPKIKSYLIKLGAPHARAEELAQDAMVAVWRKAAYFDPARASAAAWIFTIARNLRIDALRREKATVAYDLAVPEQADNAPLADQQLGDSQRDRTLRAAIAALPRDQVEVVLLSFFEDKPHSEIAHDLKLPLGTVKSRLRLAMIRLRGALGDMK